MSMENMAVFSLLFFLPLLLSGSTVAGEDILYYNCSNETYAPNSTFQSNLNHLLASLSSSPTNFTTASNGSFPDAAYGLLLCRGDITPSDCRTCIQGGINDLLSLCEGSKQGIIWYDNCQLRYDNHRFFSIQYQGVKLIMWNSNATDPDLFAKLETALLDNVTYQAAYNSSLEFATGIAYYGSGSKQKMWALVQCTQDLSADDCSDCLQQARSLYEYKGYKGNHGGRVLGGSCNFRYESGSFYAGEPTISLNLSMVSDSVPPVPAPSPPLRPPMSVPPSPGPAQGAKGSTNKALLIAIPVTLGSLLILIFGICFWRRSVKNIKGMVTSEDIQSSESLLFDLSMLKVATDNFNISKKLGQGGFGTVYKGTLPNGEDIAVKRLSASSRQGIQELKNELILVAKLQHKNLVRLLGVSLEEGENLLVYEYVPNGSLDTFLFDPAKSTQLNWEMRFKVIWGIAQGLLYLHEESSLKVIHRDLKASNILLDKDMNPKISDFGLARLFAEDETQCITSRVVGTFGYMAPEYARHGHFSMKLDVYSFGILILEIVTGKRCNGFHYNSEISEDVLSYTWEHWRNGRILEIVDPSMGEICSSNEVLRCIQIGLLCAQEIPSYRPPMLSAFLMLHNPSMALQEPLEPKFVARITRVDSAAVIETNRFELQ